MDHPPGQLSDRSLIVNGARLLATRPGAEIDQGGEWFVPIGDYLMWRLFHRLLSDALREKLSPAARRRVLRRVRQRMAQVPPPGPEEIRTDLGRTGEIREEVQASLVRAMADEGVDPGNCRETIIYLLIFHAHA